MDRGKSNPELLPGDLLPDPVEPLVKVCYSPQDAHAVAVVSRAVVS